VRRLHFPPHVQLRLPPALIARLPYEQLHTLGEVCRIGELVSPLFNAPARTALKPDEKCCGVAFLHERRL
jgi:hypothetical protein